MNNLNCFLTLELLSAQPMVQPLYAVEAGNTILLIKKSRNFENERYEHQLEKEASSECGQRKLQKVKSESGRVGERPLPQPRPGRRTWQEAEGTPSAQLVVAAISCRTVTSGQHGSSRVTRL